MSKAVSRRPARRTHPRLSSKLDRAAAESFMRLALAQARKGLGRTRPNPAVGAVVVKDGKVIARGYHSQAGGPHAEVVALRKAGAAARGADLYVTLEPCNHHGRTPPCTEAILAAGIGRVIAGCEDANPIVSGRGIAKLRRGGVQVFSGVLEEECLALNRPFFTFITEKRPFVTLKVAATADGKIATATGDSRWVTGPAARERVHLLRDQVDAVLVGARTVRQDDPQLTARPGGKLAPRQPLRVILSASLDMPPQARIFEDTLGKVLILTTSANRKKAAAFEARGAEVVRVAGEKGRVALGAALAELARREVMHLLVEGGAEVFGDFLDHDLADEVMLYIAPKILGDGLAWAPMRAKARMDHAIPLAAATVELVGEDVLITGRPR